MKHYRKNIYTGISFVVISLAITVLFFQKNVKENESSIEYTDIKPTAPRSENNEKVTRSKEASTNSDVAEYINEEHSVDEISEALKKINSSDVKSRINGINELSRLDPELTLRAIYEGVDRLAGEPDIEGMIVVGAMRIAHHEEILTNEDLNYLYETTASTNIKGRMARILSHRNDDSLLDKHLSYMQNRLLEASPHEKSNMLYELGSMETHKSVSYIKPYLYSSDENTSFSALVSLSLSGNQNDVPLVEPLLLHNSYKIRDLAASVIVTLNTTGEDHPVPVEIASASGSQ